jgi:hypothetical protein
MSIPKIIHSVWFFDEASATPDPSEFLNDCRQSVIDLHPNWKFTSISDLSYYSTLEQVKDLEYYDCYYLFRQAPLRRLNINFQSFYERILYDFRDRRGRGANKYAILSDFIRMVALYLYGGFYLDWDFYCCMPLDSFVNDDIVFAKIRDSLVAEGVIGCKPEDPRIAEILTRYCNTQVPEVGDCYLNLTSFVEEKNIQVYEPDYFIPHQRKSPPEDIYRHSDRTHFIHCWKEHTYDLERMAVIGDELRRKNKVEIPKKIEVKKETGKYSGCHQSAEYNCLPPTEKN